MKLLQETRRVNLIFSAAILFVAAVTLFFVIRVVVTGEIDEQLQAKGSTAIAQMKAGHRTEDELVSTALVAGNAITAPIFKDTMLANPVTHEQEVYRQYIFSAPVDGQNYRISVMTSRLEWDDLFITILLIFIGMAILLVVGSLLVNAATAKRVWGAFFQNLNTIKAFSIRNPEPIRLQPSPVEEFSELNAVLTNLTERMRTDYRVVREFTENASHEIQTPLAIMQSKLDRLRQHPNLDAQMAENITAISAAADRLSRLNSDLLLLARLEHRQMALDENVDLSNMLESQINAIKDLFDAKQIQLNTDFQKAVIVKGNTASCEILISNLLSNALRYTPADGTVDVHLDATGLAVHNTGVPLQFPAEEIFARFKKGDASAGSNGLGLAIAQEIVSVHQWRIEYTYHDGRHCFDLLFMR